MKWFRPRKSSVAWPRGRRTISAPEPLHFPPEAFAAALTSWFEAHGRAYPWRETRDPYAVLLSEVMLQQTQIATVLKSRYYERWLEQFPTLAVLAEATEAQILKAWEGLGYYRRARFLQATARAILERHDGIFPQSPADILALPGVGRYTAGAVASFAFDLPEPIVDGNVARVLARVFNFHETIESTEGARRLWAWAETLVKAAASPRLFNSALMELGQTLCQPAVVRCESCPVREFCLAFAHGTQLALPKKKKAVAITELNEHVALVRNGDRFLLVQERGQRRAGLWRFPEIDSALAAAAPLVLRFPYTITRYRVQLHLHELDATTAAGISAEARWFTAEEITHLAMSSPQRKAWEQYRNLNHANELSLEFRTAPP